MLLPCSTTWTIGDNGERYEKRKRNEDHPASAQISRNR